MTTPIDQPAAEDLARQALSDWGYRPDAVLLASPCPGGWRFRVVTSEADAGAGSNTGGSDAAVRAADGAVLRVPVGASDAAVARLLGF